MLNIRSFRPIYKLAWLPFLISLSAANSQNDICVTSVGGLAGLPTLDGFVSGDPGWNNAVQLNVSGDLGASTATKALLGTDGSNLWLGLIVSAPAIDQNTTLVLTFSENDGHPEKDWRLHIQPFNAALKPKADGTPQVVNFWRDSTTWNTPTAGTGPGTWEDNPANIQVTTNGMNHWELEFKIPIVTSSTTSTSDPGFCLGCNTSVPSTFKLYMNLLNTGFGGTVGPVVAPDVSQDVWPACPGGTICPLVFDPPTATDIRTLTPDPSLWGTGSLTSRSACTGVSLTAYSSPLTVGVQDPSNPLNLTTNIVPLPFSSIAETSIAQCSALADNAHPGSNGPANTFVAIPSNNMTNQAQVSVTFRLADFGIPGIDPSLGGSGLFPPLGSPVPSGCDPTKAPFTQCAGIANNPTAQGPINASSTATFNSTTWQLNYKQSCFFKFNSHQCVQVVMDSNDPSTRFLNRSVEENLNFVHASTFKQSALINGSQGNIPSPTRFLLSLDTDEDGPIGSAPPPNRGQPGGNNPRASAGASQVPRFRDQNLAAIGRQQLGAGITNMYQWIARGYVYTGTKLIINGTQYEYVRRAGDFGYVAGHTGIITGWSSSLQGTDIKQVTPFLYTAVVSPGTTSTVTTTISAKTLSKFAAFLDVGANFPQGSFSNSFSPGFSLNGGLEYIAASHLSVEGIFGYHFAPAKTSGNINIYQYSVNAKAYLTTGNIRPFVNAGIGGYTLSPGSTYFGGNVGGGLLYNLTLHWGLQGSYNFHVVDTQSSSTKFSTAQVGLRYVF